MNHLVFRRSVVGLAALTLVCAAYAGQGGSWRSATNAELKTLIPTRAPVEKENIETELRTASAVANPSGKFIAGVVLITAGYAAEGKYSNFFLTQVRMKIGAVTLPPGEYVFGWRRKDDDSLTVKFYDAPSGKFLGDVQAIRLSRVGKIESFHISPPAPKGVVQVGRFGMSYSVE